MTCYNYLSHTQSRQWKQRRRRSGDGEGIIGSRGGIIFWLWLVVVMDSCIGLGEGQQTAGQGDCGHRAVAAVSGGITGNRRGQPDSYVLHHRSRGEFYMNVH